MTTEMMMKVFIIICLFFSSNLIPESSYDYNIETDLGLLEICRTNPELLYKFNYKEYEIEYFATGDTDCKVIQIKRNEEVIYRNADIGSHFFLNEKLDFLEGSQNYLIKLAPELKQEYLPIYKWNGGAHCCYTLQLYRLGEHFTRVAEIEGSNSVPYFEDVNHDGKLEIVLWDDFLWNSFGSYAETAFAPIIFKLMNGKYSVAADLMRKESPDQNQIDKYEKKWIRAFKQETYYQEAPYSFIVDINKLVFSGNKDLAFDLIDNFWPVSQAAKESFIKKYKAALYESSLYYRHFEKAIN